MAKKFQFEDGRAYTKELRAKRVKAVFFNKQRKLDKLYDKAGELYNAWTIAVEKKEKPLAFIRLWTFVNYAMQLKEVPEYNTKKWQKRKGRMTGRITRAIDYLEKIQHELEENYDKEKANHEQQLKRKEEEEKENSKLEQLRQMEEEMRKAEKSKPQPATIDLNIFDKNEPKPSAPPPPADKKSTANDWGILRAPMLEKADRKFKQHIKETKYVVHDPNAPKKVYLPVEIKSETGPVEVKEKHVKRVKAKPSASNPNLPSAPPNIPAKPQPSPSKPVYNPPLSNQSMGIQPVMPLQPYNYPVNPNGMPLNPMSNVPLYAQPVPQYVYSPPNSFVSPNQLPPQSVLKPQKLEQKTVDTEAKSKELEVIVKGNVTDSGFLRIVGSSESQFDFPGGSNACLCCSLTFIAAAFRMPKLTDMRTSTSEIQTLLQAIMQEGVNTHVTTARKKGLKQDQNRALDEVDDAFARDFQKVEGVFGAVGKPQDETDGAGFSKVVPWYGAKYGPLTGFHLICDGGAYAWFTNSKGQAVYFDSHRRDPKSGLASPDGGVCLVWFKNHYALSNYLHALFGGNPGKPYEICISDRLQVTTV